ncbi:hypothetical protein [Oxynema aestuarii]|uniref:Uncharacterized protein n=1 Tax=Oxynema aestuarii AP17 TaxID=2064643 RepID=A0A6H1U3H1_9CYAN|nr:hypothetical protein [Oxynema aestuarii]QIZ72700.1 hypothetical protein HCG48_20620 [Oxynema aestuarii AP17]
MRVRGRHRENPKKGDRPGACKMSSSSDRRSHPTTANLRRIVFNNANGQRKIPTTEIPAARSSQSL